MAEIDIVVFFNRLWHGSFVDTLTVAISSHIFLGILVALTFLAVLFFDRKKRLKVLLASAISLFIYAGLGEFLLKEIFPRLRPFEAFPNLISVLGSASGSSFPSGHATFSVAFALPICYYYRKLWPLGVLFVLLTAFARLHNGVHYPSDILAGWIVGTFAGTVGIYAAKWFTKRF